MAEARCDIVVVLGMHRSGTSLTAGLLHALGVHMGRFLVPPRGDNPRGFFENQEIVEVHKRLNRLLQRRPMTLMGTLNMPEGWQCHPAVARYRDQLRDILAAELADAGAAPAGFKDPHTARLLPLWQELFRELGLQPRYIVCTRNPSAVAESLHRRDNIRREHAELLWVQHYLGALQVEDDAPLSVIEFEDWFGDFDAQYHRLADAAGVAREIAAARAAAARAFAAPDLNHAPRGGSAGNPVAVRLYDGMRDFAAGRTNRPALARLVKECAGAAQGFGFWSEILDGRTPALPPSWEVTAAGAAVQGPTGFATLASRLPAEGPPARPLNVCVVTYELEGPVRNSGRGSEAADIAVGLATAGHAVTILYLPRSFSEDGAFGHWVEHYAALGVELVGLGAQQVSSDAKWLKLYRPGQRLTLCRPAAFNVYQWLRHRQFDVVHAGDARGALYYCLLARRLELPYPKLQDMVFHVRAAGPDKLRLAHNALPMDDVQELGSAYMERRVVELADIVTAATPDMFAELQREHYALAQDRVLVLPHIGCRHAIAPPPPAPVREIVFFGALEPRKGLNLFVDAVGWLQRDLDGLRTACGGTLPRVRFLGAVRDEFPAREFLRQRTASWRLEVILDTERGREDALRLLSGGGRLAVLASVEAHLGMALAECLYLRLPFLAADTPANRHVLGAAAPEFLFELHPQRLAARLRERIGRPDAPRPDPSAAVDRDTWLRWHAAIGADTARWRRQFHFQPRAANEASPLVSVCVAHFNRPHYLRQSLASIEAQTYPNLEVVVVDDGSTDPDAIRFLEELEPEFARRGWRIVRQENRYLGAVRNTGARHARGKYCLFMDDDNYAKPEEVATFVRIAERTGAEILTCFAERFRGDDPPQHEHEGRQYITQLGDNLAMGLFRNGFGDSNCFVLRDFFLDVGGNSEDYKVGKDDQEFFARSVLSGARLFLVPEALYWYRETPVRMRSLHYNLYAGNLRVMRPYLAAVPAALRDVLRFAQGQMVTFQKHLGREQYRLEKERRLVLDVLESESWRRTRWMRAWSRRRRGLPAAELDVQQVREHPEPALLLASLYASASWQMAAPVRLYRRAVDAARRAWSRVRGTN